MKIPQQNTININKLLRKASSSRDPSALPKLLSTQAQEMSTTDIETPSSDGKNALHMACWMGCMDNISLLLSLGCDVNAISIGKHNYGKSPIFYAITRGRDDVVRYLLNCTDTNGSRINVKIVNNKGQSVYSLACSHDFSADILECIRNRELDDLYTWADYSATHSDGCIYGDLDLRFLSRSLTVEDVVKDGVVVNPTTKESRRGNFAKNNPSVADDSVKTVKKNTSVSMKKHKRMLSAEQRLHLEQHWNAVAKALQQKSSWDLFSSLLAIVQCWEGFNVHMPWITDSASRLDFLVKFEVIQAELLLCIHSRSELIGDVAARANLQSLLEAAVFCGSGDRHVALVKRILIKTVNDPAHESKAHYLQRHDREASLAMRQEQLSSFWNEIEIALDTQIPDKIYLALLKPVLLCDGRQTSNWTHDYSKQLHSIFDSKSLKFTDVFMQKVVEYCDASSSRYASLLLRLLGGCNANSFSEIIDTVASSSKTTSPFKKKKIVQLPDQYHALIRSLQKERAIGVTLPSWYVLTNPYLSSKEETHQLSLPKAPTLINESFELSKLESKLREVVASSSSVNVDAVREESIKFSQLVAFDSEFYTTNDGGTELATIQFSVIENGVPSAWVVDLLPRDGDYYAMTCDVLRWLFVESGSHILGFAPRHDMHLLASYLGEDLSSSTSTIWDMQLLTALKIAEDSSDNDKKKMTSLPGLKSCCSYYLEPNLPTWALSKEEQCSDWKRRPLSASQLEYAGLDAAVLLVLLSELVKRC